MKSRAKKYAEMPLNEFKTTYPQYAELVKGQEDPNLFVRVMIDNSNVINIEVGYADSEWQIGEKGRENTTNFCVVLPNPKVYNAMTPEKKAEYIDGVRAKIQEKQKDYPDTTASFDEETGKLTFNEQKGCNNEEPHQ